MTATPPVHYLTEQSLDFLSQLRNWRIKERIPAYFTIDAGPNIHVLCEPEYKTVLQNWLKEHHYHFIDDETGGGPTLKVES